MSSPILLTAVTNSKLQCLSRFPLGRILHYQVPVLYEMILYIQFIDLNKDFARSAPQLCSFVHSFCWELCRFKLFLSFIEWTITRLIINQSFNQSNSQSVNQSINQMQLIIVFLRCVCVCAHSMPRVIHTINWSYITLSPSFMHNIQPVMSLYLQFCYNIIIQTSNQFSICNYTALWRVSVNKKVA